MSETIRFLHRRMNMRCPKVLAKALELDRRASISCRSLGKGAICRSAICLELACRLCDAQLDKDELQRRSGANKKVYTQTFLKISNILRIKASGYSIRELAIKFSAMSHVTFIEKTFLAYKRRVQQDMPAAQRIRTNFSNPVYAAAIFFTCTFSF